MVLFSIYGDAMRVTCPNCGSKAVISSRENQSAHVADLYISCTEVKSCGATFVSTLAFKHYLNPPRKTTTQLATSLIKCLPREEQLDLISNFQQQNN
ncbi:ogr/Delta-like zinc finger family protein [Pseudoalteromonas ruthenica]|uniref:ogr/Delta-like zinc finger family protein n=1 Tax=Pseudoalteromonas ruthenica TaxID=151081 RepID=UPI002E11395D